MRSNVITKTANVPWKLFNPNGNGMTAAPAIDLTSGMVTPANGGAWSRVATLSAKSVAHLLGEDVNYLMIAPYVESCTSNVTQNIAGYAYRGPRNNIDRLFQVSCRTGGYIVDTRCDGQAAVTSGKYCEYLNVTNNYGNSIDLVDAGNDNGKGYLIIDLLGADQIALVLSDAPSAGRWFFEISGF